MKVYVYGMYVRSASGGRVREYESVTQNQFYAFLQCYEIGLDGDDYFLVEYDTELDKSRHVSLLDREYGDIYDQVQQHVKYGNVLAAMQKTVLRPDDV